MNFFEAQDRARSRARWLLVIYAFATLIIVTCVTAIAGFAFYTMGTPGTPPTLSFLFLVAGLTALLIVGATIYKTSLLSSGGSRVATDMGGTLVTPDVQDPERRRLRNVVEEMAIASGVPVPDIYVLEAEDGINAFAAGYTPADAAIAVTRGALEVLTRDELQGVIAHEFSHVLNGDMRVNIRLMGVLFGIMVLSLIGRAVLRGGYYRGLVSSRRSRGTPAVMAIGASLAILGWIGVLFARLIKAAYSREREMLADASAVQFTRQTAGLANALKKIGGYKNKSWIDRADPEEVSHMLFASGTRRLISLYATHPPLLQRIKALDPSFREEDYSQARPGAADSRADAQTSPPAAAFSGAVPTTDVRETHVDLRNTPLSGMIGQPTPRQISFARQLRKAIPVNLHQAAHSRQSAFLLALALVLDRSGRILERQLRLLEEQLGSERSGRVKGYYDDLQKAGVEFGLPLLEISFPALKQRPAAQLEFLIELSRRLIDIDQQTDLHEYCFYKILVTNLDQSSNPAGYGSHKRISKSKVRQAALQLVQIVASYGHDRKVARDAAFRAGIAQLGHRVADDQNIGAEPSQNLMQLDDCLRTLQTIAPASRERLVDAVAATISHDAKIRLAEAELLRAICASLHCPLPPLILQAPADRPAEPAMPREQEMPG